MTMERERMQNVQPMMRNTPMRARQWRDLLDRDDIALAESESGQLVLVPQDGQLNLHYAVMSEEHHQAVAARIVYTSGDFHYKLVYGEGEITEVLRDRAGRDPLRPTQVTTRVGRTTALGDRI